MYYLYIIISLKSNYNYVGVTKDLKRRLKEHNLGISFSTKPYAPYKLIYSESFINLPLARQKENWIKTKPEGRLWKKQIIRRVLEEGH